MSESKDTNGPARTPAERESTPSGKAASAGKVSTSADKTSPSARQTAGSNTSGMKASSITTNGAAGKEAPGKDPSASSRRSEGKELLNTTLVHQQIKDKKDGEKVEDSIPLRVAALAMVVLLITASSAYFNTPILLALMFIWFAMFGTLLSYWFREKRPMWVMALPSLGAIALMAFLIQQFTIQIEARHIDLRYPFTIALSGFLAFQCFDLRRRLDFAVSALIGLCVLVCTAMVANDLFFFGWILAYMTAVSTMLYFDCVSRSKEVGPSRPIGEGRPASMPKPAVRRQARAATSIILLPVLSLPLVTVIMFFCMPRSTSVIEWVLTNLVRPYVSVSRSSRDKGLSPGGLPTGSRPGHGKGNTPGGVGGGGGADGGEDGEAGSKGINPLDTSTGRDGKSPRGVGRGGGQSQPYKEGVDKKPPGSDYMPPSDRLDEVVMRVLAPRPGYARRSTYDKYDGKSWERTGPIAEVWFPKNEENVIEVGNANALVVPPDCPTVEVKQQIIVDQPPPDGLLPSYWIPQTIFGFDSLTVQSDGVLKPEGKLTPGKQYEVLSYLPIYRAKKMRDLPNKKNSEFKRSLFLPPPEELQKAENELMKKYRQLPKSLPEEVRKTAEKVVGNDGNWFVKSERIAAYLKKHCKYKTENIQRMSDGDFVYNFLFRTMEGNCAEFSTAFVVMARSTGIPARLVAGYLPGRKNKSTGYIEVRMRDGHAWAEIYLPDWGWIPFDPTPAGNLPEFEKSEGIFSQLADMGLANPFGNSMQRQNSGPGLGHGITGSDLAKKITQDKRKKEGKDPDGDGQFDLIKAISKLTWEPFVVLAILVSTGMMGYMFLHQRKMVTSLGIPENARKSTLLFFQVLNDLRKYKIARLPTDTPLELFDRIHISLDQYRQSGKFVHPDLEPLLQRFMETYTLERFGRTGTDRVGELESMSEKIKQLVNQSK